MIKPKTNCLLISEPYLQDPDFYRKVIWLIDGEEDMTMGVIINNPITQELEFASEKIVLDTSDGGPIKNNFLICIHQFSHIKNNIHLVNEYYTAGDLLEINEASRKNPKAFCRYYMGYCGWTTEQLAAEIEQKTWFVSEFDSLIINTAPEKMYETAIKKLGPSYAHYAHAPKEIYLN